MTATPDIFLSYNREDQARAKLFAEAFEAQGFKVWWDVGLRTGEAYDEVTEAALRTAKAVVVLWSKKSVQSRWVRAEATLADRNKTLVPCMIEPCERPIMFELTQTAELGHWQGQPDDRVWAAFLADVKQFVGQDAPSAPIVDAAAQPTAKGARGDRPSLAVMPFANRSGQADDDVFAIGMVEDVIDALSLGVNVRVISSSATARFRNGAAPDLEAMGRQLGVNYLLEGNVRRTGDNLRVTAQLVAASNGGILWTQRFARPLSELASMQEDLVIELAAHLDAQVYRIEMARALAKPASPTAWECITRAQASFRQLDPKSQTTGIEDAARAIALAPQYGVAHAVHAMTTALRYFVHSLPDAPTEREVQNSIDRAFALDADNPAVLTYVAQALNFLGRPQVAISHVERAIRTSPGYNYAYFVCANSCQMLNRIDEALKHVETDLQCSPGSHLEYINWYYRTLVNVRKGDWNAAIACIDRSLALNPNPVLTQFYKALVLIGCSRHEEAREVLRVVRAAEPGTPFELWDLRLIRPLINYSGLNEMRGSLRKLWDEKSA
jgi:TolB-like protein